MSKEVMISTIAEELSMTKVAAAKTFDAVFDVLVGYLKKEGSIRLPGFGTFSVKKRAAREGRNPSTGEHIKIPARKVVTFKPAKDLKERVEKENFKTV